MFFSAFLHQSRDLAAYCFNSNFKHKKVVTLIEEEEKHRESNRTEVQDHSGIHTFQHGHYESDPGGSDAQLQHS
ncbi:hypothetical protein A6R68_15786 [Neotoma lepida]|uniref:Uncharacterized protein n=1 Tax=Neotoma lepida TaxID=56216 RepID=A0A1A6H7U8_NEOLE|nr:hypothetical protein A6R68_15786 [Neotoma lepida]